MPQAQVLPQSRGTISGVVTDSMEELVPDAVVSLMSEPGEATAPLPPETTDRTGSFRFHVPAGTYRLHVEGAGFAPFTSEPVTLLPEAHVGLPVRLVVAGLHEEITVPESASDGSDPAGITNATILEGASLRALSNDRTTMLQQLTVLMGGTGQPQIMVDGFTGGKLPPKASIRSISLNRNPFSAYFSEFGLTRVEVTTQPGGDKLHGEVDLSGTDQALDAGNPYSAVKPPFSDFQQAGSLSGPVNRTTSFNVSDEVEDLANSSVVNAADPESPSVLLSTYAQAPQHQQTYAARLDHQFSSHHFGYVRDEWNRTTVVNSGILPLVLPQSAFGSDLISNALQLSDTQVLGQHAVNEIRFQYLRTRLRQTPNATSPSVLVQSSFQAGGAPSQVMRDSQDLYESQDRFEKDAGHHALRAGFRWTFLRDANASSAGFNGQYIFADVNSYLAGRAEQYSQTAGQPAASLTDSQFGLYAEDDWKVSPNLTLSYGLRMESQSAIPDHADPAPRVGFAWAVKPRGRKTPLFTLRAGYGVFLNHFPDAQLLQTIHQNGSLQVTSIAMDVSYSPTGPPPGAAFQAGQPTVFALQPGLHSQYAQIGSVTVNRALGSRGSLIFNATYDHDAHEYITRNANSPLPGTFDPAVPGSGVRPLGTNANIYQFASTANANQELVSLTYRYQVTSKFYAYGLLKYDKNFSESDGVSTFAAHPYDLKQDYGRTIFDLQRSLSAGFLWTLPEKIQAMFFVAAHSGAPFDITTGADGNGDTIYNDRPIFASAASGMSVVNTAYGKFDVSPGQTATQIPRDYGTSPAYVWSMLRATREFRLGPRPVAAPSGPGASSTAGPAERPWALSFGVEIHNVSNHNNPGPPVGAISAQPCGAQTTASCSCTGGACGLVPSAYFGHSLSLAPDFSPITASNRTILLQTTFSF